MSKRYEKVRKSMVLGMCTASLMYQPVTLFGGTTPQDVEQIQDMNMTEKEMEFAGFLSGPAVESFIQMSHTDRTRVMELVKEKGFDKDGTKMSSNEAVMRVAKERMDKTTRMDKVP